MQPREFRRAEWGFAVRALEFAVLVLLEVFILAPSDRPEGIAVCVMAGLIFAQTVWEAATPYVKTTDEGITVFAIPLQRKTVAWEDIQSIDLATKRLRNGVPASIVLVLLSGTRVRIHLGCLDREDGQQLIEHLQDGVAATRRAGANCDDAGPC